MNEISRLARLTTIITMLQSKSILTSTEITRKFGISKRTAYRDVKSLIESGIPIFTIEGKGYSLVDGYNLPPVMFSDDEANALITANSIIKQNRDQSLADNHSAAIEKIKAVMKDRGKRKTEMLSERVAIMKNHRGSTTSNSLASIQKAITELLKINIEYTSVDLKQSSRVLQPQALYHTQENWILIAWCELREAYREFRLDRIQRLSLTSDLFTDRGFHLQKYFQAVISKAKTNP